MTNLLPLLLTACVGLLVPNENVYVGMAIVWLTVSTLAHSKTLARLLNVAVLNNVGTISQTLHSHFYFGTRCTY